MVELRPGSKKERNGFSCKELSRQSIVMLICLCTLSPLLSSERKKMQEFVILLFTDNQSKRIFDQFIVCPALNNGFFK
jgi:hypothetical protein